MTRSRALSGDAASSPESLLYFGGPSPGPERSGWGQAGDGRSLSRRDTSQIRPPSVPGPWGSGGKCLLTRVFPGWLSRAMWLGVETGPWHAPARPPRHTLFPPSSRGPGPPAGLHVVPCGPDPTVSLPDPALCPDSKGTDFQMPALGSGALWGRGVVGRATRTGALGAQLGDPGLQGAPDHSQCPRLEEGGGFRPHILFQDRCSHGPSWGGLASVLGGLCCPHRPLLPWLWDRQAVCWLPERGTWPEPGTWPSAAHAAPLPSPRAGASRLGGL